MAEKFKVPLKQADSFAYWNNTANFDVVATFHDDTASRFSPEYYVVIKRKADGKLFMAGCQMVEYEGLYRSDSPFEYLGDREGNIEFKECVSEQILRTEYRFTE